MRVSITRYSDGSFHVALWQGGEIVSLKEKPRGSKATAGVVSASVEEVFNLIKESTDGSRVKRDAVEEGEESTGMVGE